MRDKTKDALAKEIWNSVIAYLKAYRNITKDTELKNLKDKYKDKHSDFVQRYKDFDDNMKNKEGKGLFKRTFDKRSKEIALALNNHKVVYTYWK